MWWALNWTRIAFEINPPLKNKLSSKKIEFFLPIYEEILSQFAANLILHLPAEDAKITAIECYEQYQFDPCFYHSFYNPEADSEAIKSRQDPVQVRNTLLLFFRVFQKNPNWKIRLRHKFFPIFGSKASLIFSERKLGKLIAR